MQKITATSKGFKGEVYIVYGADNKLLSVDFQAAELTMAQTLWLMKSIPVQYDAVAFLESLSAAKLEFVHSAFEVTFDMFWVKYDKKINKARCLTIWNRLSKVKRAKAYFGITSYNAHLSKNQWKTKADPETYLIKEMYENQYDESK